MAKLSFRNEILWKALLLAIISAGLLYFYYQLFHDYIPFLTHSRNMLFGADTNERINSFGIHGRHLLHHIFSVFLKRFFYSSLGRLYSAKLVSAIMGTLSSLTIFFICYKISEDFPVSIMLFLSYALSATILVFSSIPDTYMSTAFMTNLLVLFYLYSDVTKIKYSIILAVVVAASCFASGHHLLTIVFTVSYIFLENYRNRGHYIKYPLIFLITCLSLILLPIVLYSIFIPGDYKDFLWHFRHQLRYCYLPALFHWDAWKSTLINFSLFSISPPDWPLTIINGTIPIKSFPMYFAKLSGLGFITAYLLLLIISIKNIYGHRNIFREVAVICTFGLMHLIFFVIYDPGEALGFAFASFFLFFIFCLIAKGVSFKSRLINRVLISLFCIFISINNISFLKNVEDHVGFQKARGVKDGCLSR